MKEIRSIIFHYDAWRAAGKQMAVATVVDTEASSYRRIGARMLVTEDGQWIGGISGGCLEGDALRRAREAIFNNRPLLRTYDTREEGDATIGLGLGCQGKIDVLFRPIDSTTTDNAIETLRCLVNTRSAVVLFTLLSGQERSLKLLGLPEISVNSFSLVSKVALPVLKSEVKSTLKTRRSKVITVGQQRILLEYLAPETRVVVVGDNYDVSAMGEQCVVLGWEMHLVGTLRKFTKRHKALAASIRDHSQLSEIELDEHTAVVLMSHDYQRDLTALRHFLPLQPFYLGVLGPQKRKAMLLEETGMMNTDFLYAPIGLDIGATGPEEIALCVTAEILSVLRNRTAVSLRRIKGSIHQ